MTIRQVLRRLPATAIAAVALYEAVVGIAAAPLPAPGTRWATAYGPPPWMFGILIALTAGLAVALAWRVVPTKASRWLALFAALLACGYGTILAPDAFQGFNGLVFALVRDMRASAIPEMLVRAIALPLLSLPNLTWLPAWLFAAATFLRFTQIFPEGSAVAEPADTNRAAKAAVLLSSWIYTANMLEPTAGRVWCGVLVAAAATAWVWWRRGGWLIFGLAAAALLQAIARAGADGLAGTLVFLPVASAGFVGGLSLVPATEPVYVFLLPALVSLVVLIQFEPAVNLGLGLTPWLLVCFVVGIRLMAARAPTLTSATRNQALWVFSGCSLACVLAVSFAATAALGVIAGCSPADTTALCLLYRYQDWLLMLPMPALLVFLTIALLYKGDIDATALFHRTTLYGGVTLVMIFVFGMVDYEVSVLLGRYFPTWFSPAAAAGSLALAVGPIRKSLDQWTDWAIRSLLHM